MLTAHHMYQTNCLWWQRSEILFWTHNIRSSFKWLTISINPGDYNGDLQSYIQLKAPSQTPQDLSGLVKRTGDYNGDLESNIGVKTPEPDLSALVVKPGDYNGDLESCIRPKAPDSDVSDYSLTIDADVRNKVAVCESANYTTTSGIYCSRQRSWSQCFV